MSARMYLPSGGGGVGNTPTKNQVVLGNSWCLRQPQGPEVKKVHRGPWGGGSDLDGTRDPRGQVYTLLVPSPPHTH